MARPSPARRFAASTPLALAVALALLPGPATARQDAPPPLPANEPPPAPPTATTPPASTPPPSAVLPPLRISRITSKIDVDGDLSDAGWQQAEKIATWFETNPGDNLEPKVANLAWLGYDQDFLYAAFQFADPNPRAIKAPLGDRDNVPSYTDYGGVIIDPRNDGKTAQMFLANPRGIQYDALTSDASGEDSAPDFFWDSAGRITEGGWVMEMRIPFSSLRYQDSDPEQWRIMLYRNMPREFRYQMFTSRLPRDSNCFICNTRPLVGLAGLPSGSHWVLAPYATGSQVAEPAGGRLGAGLESDDPSGEMGLDAKWIPNPNMVFDATLNPDFSQIESDQAQISANERFALFFPERRPFFLESVDMFSTPFQAIYTRTFNQPLWGARSTGQVGDNVWTVLAGQDEGDGGIILPGVLGSGLAVADFESTVAIGRYRRDLGSGFASLLYSGREMEDGAYNRVFGPDFRWMPSGQDTVTGQLLFSRSQTPVRPDLAEEWDGRSLEGWAGQLWWSRSLQTWDFFAYGQALDDEFRADNGFVNQVGIREGLVEVGHTYRPEGKFYSRLRLFTISHYKDDQDGNKLELGVIPGFGVDAKLNSFIRMEFAYHELRGIEKVHERWQLRPQIEVRPGKVFSFFSLSGRVGQEVDFDNDRRGTGMTLFTRADVRPTDQLLLTLNADRRFLDVPDSNGEESRLFTADVLRLRANYTFSARSWLRLIGQYVSTERDPALYTFPVREESGTFSSSAVFAYKLNWQTVLFLGLADNQLYEPVTDGLEAADRSVFVKVSYAFQG
jgi:hypothetical protein